MLGRAGESREGFGGSLEELGGVGERKRKIRRMDGSWFARMHASETGPGEGAGEQRLQAIDIANDGADAGSQGPERDFGACVLERSSGVPGAWRPICGASATAQ